MRSYILFDHATGYALFQIKKSDEIGSFLSQVQNSTTDLDRFGKMIKLVGFRPFKTAIEALENSRSCSDGIAPKDLVEFITSTITKKLSKSKLGIVDAKLAASVQDAVQIKCEYGESVIEITRGIRLFFDKLIPSVSSASALAAQLGLSHSYSRSKVQFNAKKNDNMIIQSSCLLEQIDKDINTFCMRIREWYSYHFPELYTIVKDNATFIKAVSIISDRNNLDDESVSSTIYEQLENLLDKDRTDKIFESAKSSVGMDINQLDIINIKNFCNKVIKMIEYRQNLGSYMNNKMNSIAPNLTAIIGENVGARLITQAGGLSNLVKCPASTLQILGAEKALFRALKTRSKTPKYGIIFNSTFISRAPSSYKGRVSRLLAHKCSIAVRLDFFQEISSNVIGKTLCQQIEERLAFLMKPSKNVPRSNTEVMEEAILSLAKSLKQSNILTSSKKSTKEVTEEHENIEMSEKKKKKRKSKSDNNNSVLSIGEIEESGKSKKSKKRKQKVSTVEGSQAKVFKTSD